MPPSTAVAISEPDRPIGGGDVRAGTAGARPSAVEGVGPAAPAPDGVSSARRRPEPRSWRPPKVMRSGVFLAAVASVVVVVAIMWGFGGWQYYWRAEDVRAYTDHHHLMCSSGVVGRGLGAAGLCLMLVMHVYTLRKRLRWMRNMGRITTWLDFHIFCGVLGPVLVTLHTSFKFNGLISVAYWSMVLVVASGFVGRYLYVRIPRSIRGRLLSRQEVSERAGELKTELVRRGLPSEVALQIDAFERAEDSSTSDGATWTGLLFGGIRTRFRLGRLGRAVQRESTDRHLAKETMGLIAERASLLRRIAYLERTRRLFNLWHVYHKPLAVVMALIVILHVAVVWYFGYAFSVR